MKKKNKKVVAIKQAKARKRNKAKQKYATASKEKLNMRKNKEAAFRMELIEKYREALMERFNAEK